MECVNGVYEKIKLIIKPISIPGSVIISGIILYSRSMKAIIISEEQRRAYMNSRGDN